MNIQRFKCLSNEEITNIERQFNVSFPNDYKKFLGTIGGGVVEKDDSNNIYVPILGEPIIVDVLYGNEKEKASITFWMNQYKEDLLDQAVIIGDDLMQGFFVLICEGQNSGVYYWDDAYNFECSTDENNMYWIADTFNDFLNLIK